MSDTKIGDVVQSGAAHVQAATDAARQVGGQAQQAGREALGHVRDVAHEAQERGASLAQAAGDQLNSVAQTQKDALADRLEHVAEAVHRSGEALEGQQDFIAHMVERGAAELSTLANTLRTNDMQSLLGELTSLAKRQPALFVGATMAAGFALARVGRLAVTGATQAAGASTGAGQSASGAMPVSSMTGVDTTGVSPTWATEGGALAVPPSIGPVPGGATMSGAGMTGTAPQVPGGGR